MLAMMRRQGSIHRRNHRTALTFPSGIQSCLASELEAGFQPKEPTEFMRKIKVTSEIPLRFHLNKFEGWAMGRVFKAQRVVEAQERANVNNGAVEPLGPRTANNSFQHRN